MSHVAILNFHNFLKAWHGYFTNMYPGVSDKDIDTTHEAN